MKNNLEILILISKSPQSGKYPSRWARVVRVGYLKNFHFYFVQCEVQPMVGAEQF